MIEIDGLFQRPSFGVAACFFHSAKQRHEKWRQVASEILVLGVGRGAGLDFGGSATGEGGGNAPQPLLGGVDELVPWRCLAIMREPTVFRREWSEKPQITTNSKIIRIFGGF